MSHNNENEIIFPFPECSRELGEREINAYGPVTLAFIGDAVYSLLVREALVLSGDMTASALHRESVKYVNASFQSQMVRILTDELTEQELSAFKRGRNAHSGHMPKNQSAADYRYATGLEALYGYLYLKNDIDRMRYLFDISTKKYIGSKIDPEG